MIGNSTKITQSVSGKILDAKDIKIIEAIHRICDRGGNVQVKRNSDGSLKVQEIKVHTVVG